MAQVILNIMKSDTKKPTRKDWIVATCMKSSDDLVTLFFAIWKAGASYLPIDPSCPDNRFSYMIEDAKPFLVVFDDSHRDRKADKSKRFLSISDLKRMSASMDCEDFSTKESQRKISRRKALVLYTSGSTGVPRGVKFRHFTLMQRIFWNIETFPYSPSENFCVFKTAAAFIDHVA
jgi:non-ribosomal peptide synthetase component F